MKKYQLEDLKKDRVFTAPPQGYLDKLPGIIQAKTAGKTDKKVSLLWVRALKLVPAAALVAFIALYSGLFNNHQAVEGFDQILSEVSSEEIIQYLEEMDITNDEILEEVDLTAFSLQFGNTQDPLIDNLEIEDDALMQLYDDFDIQDSLL